MDLLSRLYGTPGLVPGMQMMQNARQSMLPDIYAGLEPALMQLIQGQMALPGLEAQFDASMQPQAHPEVENLWQQFMQAKQAPMPQINQTQVGVAAALGGMGDVMRGNGSQQGAQNAQAQVTMSKNDMLMHRMDTLDTLQQAYSRAAKSADTGDELTRRKLLEKRDSLLKQMLTIQEGLRESGLKSADIRAGLEGIRTQVSSREREGAADRASQERIAAGHDAASMENTNTRVAASSVTAVKPGDYQREKRAWTALLGAKGNKIPAEKRAQFTGFVLNPIAGELPAQAGQRVARDLPLLRKGKRLELPPEVALEQLLDPAEAYPQEQRQAYVDALHARLTEKWKPAIAAGDQKTIELVRAFEQMLRDNGYAEAK